VKLDVGQLARWQVAIYRLHDAQRFDELAATVSNIFVALGRSDRVAEAVGHWISTAYQLADQAEIASRAGSLSDERDRYRQARESLNWQARVTPCLGRGRAPLATERQVTTVAGCFGAESKR
jgi:hypothetical protein